MMFRQVNLSVIGSEICPDSVYRIIGTGFDDPAFPFQLLILSVVCKVVFPARLFAIPYGPRCVQDDTLQAEIFPGKQVFIDTVLSRSAFPMI